MTGSGARYNPGNNEASLLNLTRGDNYLRYSGPYKFDPAGRCQRKKSTNENR